MITKGNREQIKNKTQGAKMKLKTESLCAMNERTISQIIW
jgi:hypothetical protein